METYFATYSTGIQPWQYLLIISMAVSVISLTVTKTKIFKGLRIWIKSKSDFLGELFSCPLCFSFYPSFFIMMFYCDKLKMTVGPTFDMFGIEFYPFDFGMAWFSIVCIASLFTGLIYRAISQIE